MARWTGLSVSVLRAWERRYGLGPHLRSTGGHRLYSQLDIRNIEDVRDLVRKGWTLGAAARQVLAPPAAAIAQASPVPGGMPGGPGPMDLEAAVVAYEATRRLMRAVDAAEVHDLVTATVRKLGGTIVPAQTGPAAALVVDVSLGTGFEGFAYAAPGSPARARMDAFLPALVEDARSVLVRLETGQTGPRYRPGRPNKKLTKR